MSKPPEVHCDRCGKQISQNTSNTLVLPGGNAFIKNSDGSWMTLCGDCLKRIVAA
jgi:hypothetical protein